MSPCHVPDVIMSTFYATGEWCLKYFNFACRYSMQERGGCFHIITRKNLEKLKQLLLNSSEN